ncbi:hypothetical protein F5148DRAFT_1155895 [Russula earlei]|uniref:Uncharacterized protein n=1 Tax=Russula earlei TaxID=71964 RepID=A0ACC0UP65_9AGAM|nr:hypothetical protein F5148DRAFT_1155895 [Russula earlei]
MGTSIASFFAANPAIVIAMIVPILYIVILSRPSGPIRLLPGPKPVSLLTGSIPRGVWVSDAQVSHLEWTRRYGPVFRYRSWFMMSKVITTDPQALNYILNTPGFVKRGEGRQFFERLLGKGVLVIEGLQHKKQVEHCHFPFFRVLSHPICTMRGKLGVEGL